MVTATRYNNLVGKSGGKHPRRAQDSKYTKVTTDNTSSVLAWQNFAENPTKNQGSLKANDTPPKANPQHHYKLIYGHGEMVPPPIPPSVDDGAVAANGGTACSVINKLNSIIARILEKQPQLDFTQAILEAAREYCTQYGCPALGVSVVYTLEFSKKRSCESWNDIRERQEELSRPGCRPANPMKCLKYVGWPTRQSGIYIGVTFDSSPLRFGNGQMLCRLVPAYTNV